MLSNASCKVQQTSIKTVATSMFVVYILLSIRDLFWTSLVSPFYLHFSCAFGRVVAVVGHVTVLSASPARGRRTHPAWHGTSERNLLMTKNVCKSRYKILRHTCDIFTRSLVQDSFNKFVFEWESMCEILKDTRWMFWDCLCIVILLFFSTRGFTGFITWI